MKSIVGPERLERREVFAASLELVGPATALFEGEQANFTLRLSEPVKTTERVIMTTVAGTATYGSDYFAPLSTQIVFAPGQTEKTFAVQTLRDSGGPKAEGRERFQVVATPVTTGLGTRMAEVTIADYVPPPVITVGGGSVVEGNTGTTTITFSVGLSRAYPKPVTVPYQTRNGTASTADNDYVAASGVLTFAPDELQKTVVVTVNGDRKLEPDETFSLVLGTPTNATLGQGSAVATIVNDEVDAAGFQIIVTYDSTVTANQKLAFDRAAARWSQIITGDVPSVVDGGVFIDDITISASVPAIDGPGEVLGQARPTAFRGAADNYLPYKGVMQFDSADVANLESTGQFVETILHEMGHVLGFGTLWDQRGFLQGTVADPIYTGSNAVREYNSIFGTTARGVPVENTGGAGTANSHWRETVFRSELMTGYLNSGVPNPISRITVGQFQDLGYAVNYAAADTFSKPVVVAGETAAAFASLGTQAGARAGGLPVLKRREVATSAIVVAAAMQASISTPQAGVGIAGGGVRKIMLR